jgi:hypothetical protein
VILDEPELEPPPAAVPLLVVEGGALRLVEAVPAAGSVAEEIQRRLATGTGGLRLRRRDRAAEESPRLVVAGSAPTND